MGWVAELEDLYVVNDYETKRWMPAMGMEDLEAGEYWNYRGREEGNKLRKAHAETVPLSKQWIKASSSNFLVGCFTYAI
jgi:hypothetical protein